MATAPDSLTQAKQTPLYPAHKRLGAKFTEFGGWDMPVQYSGLVAEHLAVRESIGIFDVSHMGEILVEGPHALAFLQYVSTNDVSNLDVGDAQYSLLLNESGGVVDDIIVYKFSDTSYFLCVNAANTEKDFSWLTERNSDENLASPASLKNVSKDYAQIAVQGPQARLLVSRLFLGENLSEVAEDFSSEKFPSFTFQQRELALDGQQERLILAATGYTGEDGFEIFLAPERAEALWERLIELGATPAGLGARDTLRLEACYPLHGHELGDDISALCSNVAWVIKFDKEVDFYGKAALLKEKSETGIPYRLRGVEVLVPGIVREGAKLYAAEKEVGWVSSGTKPPTVGKAVGLAFVERELATLGTELEAEVRSRRLKVKLIKLPFYKRSE